MKKRTFRLVAIAVLLVVCLCATTLLAACNKESTYYLSKESNEWTVYGRRDTIPDDVRFVINADGTYSLTVDLDAGDSFVIYKTGSSKNVITDIFSNRTELTLNDEGKVSVGAKGKYVLTIDVESGELSYSFTAPTPQPSTVAVTGVSLNPTSLNMTVGGADQTLTATVAPENATDKSVTWLSDHPEIATVSNGTVHAVKAGTAIITVTTVDGGKTATCNVTVSDAQQGGQDPVAVTDIYFNLSSSSVALVVQETKAIEVSVEPANATNKAFTVEVVGAQDVIGTQVVDGSLKITGLKPGEVQVKVASVSNPTVVSDPITVTVSGVSVQSITVEDLQLDKNQEADLEVKIVPSNANAILTYSVPEGTTCITVSDTGHVVALDYGTVVVTVSDQSTGKFGTCTVTVSKPVSSISLSETSIVTYVEASREITVNFYPADATLQEVTVSIQQSGNFIECTADGAKISVEGIAVGTAVVTVTSKDNPDAKATLNVEVKAATEAVPYTTAPSVLELNFSAPSDTYEVKLDSGTINSVSYSVSGTSVTVTDKDDSAHTFKLSPAGYGASTVTITVEYNDTSATLTVTVYVVSASFVLEGTVGGQTEWNQTADKAKEGERLFTRVRTGVYTLTRDFSANDSFRPYPNGVWTDEPYDLVAWQFFKAGDAANFGVGQSSDPKNIAIAHAGNYTITLDFTKSTLNQIMSVTVNSIVITNASISATNPSLTKGETESTVLTLTILPSVVTIDDPEKIQWTVQSAYSTWLTLTPGGDAMTCTVALTSAYDGSDTDVTITVTINHNGVVTTATFVLPLGSIKPVTEVVFDDNSNIVELDVSEMTLNNWETYVTAHVNSNASVKGVTYSIKESVYANGTADIPACTIGLDGLVNAKMFGTFTIVATAVGTDASGAHPFAEKQIRVYASSFYLNTNWNKDFTKNPATSEDHTTYTWTGLNIFENTPVVILYAGLGSEDEWSSVISNSQVYLDTTDSTAGVITTASDKFTVNTEGNYTITLNLSASMPKVTFVRTGDAVEPEDWEYTAGVYLDYATKWTEGIASITGQTITKANPTVTFTYDFNNSVIATESGSKFDYHTVVDGAETWYGNSSYHGITFTGSVDSQKAWGSNPWYNYHEADDKANDQLQFSQSSGLKQVNTGKIWQFTFTFNWKGIVTAINIQLVNTGA